MHTVPFDDQGQGTIWQLISREPGAVYAGMSPTREAVFDHPQYKITGWHDSFRGLSDEELRVLYNAADLVVSPTMAEGFGLTLAEAMGCGTPVVATDYSAVSEVVGPGGILVPHQRLLTNAYAHEWALVDEEAMTAAVERIIDRPGRLRSLGEAGRQHVKKFSWQNAAEAFDRLMRAAVAA
jgi:glycosyltransferase involved in cell wall biosynthesis